MADCKLENWNQKFGVCRYIEKGWEAGKFLFFFGFGSEHEVISGEAAQKVFTAQDQRCKGEEGSSSLGAFGCAHSGFSGFLFSVFRHVLLFFFSIYYYYVLFLNFRVLMYNYYPKILIPILRVYMWILQFHFSQLFLSVFSPKSLCCIRWLFLYLMIRI